MGGKKKKKRYACIPRAGTKEVRSRPSPKIKITQHTLEYKPWDSKNILDYATIIDTFIGWRV